MSGRGFSVTFSVITPESAKRGDFEKAGFVQKNVSLRKAFNALKYEGDAHCADRWPISAQYPPRSLDFFPEIDHATGSERSLSLHLPAAITPSSAMRVARIFGLQP